ncbi:hypothetical protein JOQ06_012763, partial [Pogonophryne albipinna]
MSNLPLGRLLCVIRAAAPGLKYDAGAVQSRVRGEGLECGIIMQPHTIVNTIMMAALKHWTGFSEQDRTLPTVHFMLNIALSDRGRAEEATTPFLPSDRKPSDS